MAMEQKLRVSRTIAVASFFAALGLLGWSLFAQWRTSFVAFAFLAHLSLCVFVATESFGPIAAKRTTASRVLARVFLVPCLFVVVGEVYYLAGLATS